MEEDKQFSIASLSDKRSKQQRPPPSPKAAPWLVFPNGKGKKYQSFYNPCEPNNRNCRKSIPEMQRRSYYHKPSHQGWLIVIGDIDENAQYSLNNSNFDDCFLWNPATLETIQLPSLNLRSFTRKSQNYCLFDLVLSSPPATCNPSDDDRGDGCMVFFLSKHTDLKTTDIGVDPYMLVFCRPGDKKWRKKGLSIIASSDRNVDVSLSIMSLVCCFRGQLYAICHNSWVVEIDIQKLWQSVVVDNQTQYKIRTFKVREADFPAINGTGEEFETCTDQWVESGNDIFRVHFTCTARGFRQVVSIHILKLDFPSMSWVLLKSLDDHVLFLCINMELHRDKQCFSTASCSAADMGLKRGCLFYTLPKDQTLYIFEVEDGGTTVISPCSKLPTPWFMPTWIMMPATVNRHVTGRRRSLEDFLFSKDATDIMDDQGKINMSRIDNSGRGESEVSKDCVSLKDYDSIEAIARILHPVDYNHFRLVCKQNSMVLPAFNRRSASTRTIASKCLSPWLVSILEDNEETICNFVDPMHNNEKYIVKVSDQVLAGARIRFSKDGWLLLSVGKHKVFFYNPFTKETIRLPDLPDECVPGGMSFSSVPTSPDCVVIVISNFIPLVIYAEISFFVIEPEKRASGWATHAFTYEFELTNWMDHFIPCINNPVFYNGALYCLDYNGMLGVLDIKDDFSWKVLPKSLQKFNGIHPSFLVECDEQLLLVHFEPSGKSIEIYRLDDMVWTKHQSLGKHALFISYTSSFSAVAPLSCMENKIYLSRLYGESILYYSLDTRRYNHSWQDFHNTKERSNCSWIEPNWSRTFS